MPVEHIRGFDLAYDIAGAGTGVPLVWGHGLMGSRGISAAYPLVDLGVVEAKRSVLRYDAHGHGLSSLLTDPVRGSWAELAKDQVALIDHLGFERVAVGGVSMGAGTALHAALTLGDRLDRMVLVIPPTGWEERAPQVAVYEQSAQLVDAHGCRAMVQAMAALPSPGPFEGTTIAADRRSGSLGGADPVRVAACLRGAAHADLPPLERLAAVEAPTLVLAWTNDAGHPVSTAERLGEHLPNVEVAIAVDAADFATWSSRISAFIR